MAPCNQILKVGNGTVHRDIAYLDKQADDQIKNHIKHLSQQYQRCSNGLEQVLRNAWNIVIKESVNQTNKLQALSLISDCYRHQMDLSTNADIIDEAMHFVSQNTEQLNKLHQHQHHNDKEAEGEAETKDKTTNSVF
jgi:hypothetical protein